MKKNKNYSKSEIIIDNILVHFHFYTSVCKHMCVVRHVCFFKKYCFIFLFKYILFIMLLQLSHFFLIFIPLCPAPPSHQYFPPYHVHGSYM